MKRTLQNQQILKGRIVYWDARARRGVIESSDGAEFYLERASLVPAFENPQSGQTVLFRRALRHRQEFVACQVMAAL